MLRLSLVCSLLLVTAAAQAQPYPFRPPAPFPPAPPMPPPPPYYAPRPYYAPAPQYVPYVRPINFTYARKASIFRGIGIPLLAVGVPMAVAGGIVWIVGAACDRCSHNVSYTGIGLLAGGIGLFLPGAILTGIGNYYRWMARVTAHADFGVALARDGGGATVTIRF